MRKFPIFSAVLSLFLLVPASIIWAQTISSQKGLSTLEFSSRFGSVKLYLPDDIRPGDMISGTLVAAPSGNNERQVARNLADLVKYKVSIDGTKYDLSEKPVSFQWLVHQDRELSVPVELLQADGKNAGTVNFPFRSLPAPDPEPPNYCVIPSHALTASPLRIQGSFDGDGSNTRCMLGQQNMEILAESPRQCQVMYPSGAQGPQTLQVSENGENKCTRPISGVDMQVTTGDLNLRKGQSTYIDVKLTGLQHLPDKAVLTITNITPAVVTMTNGNVQVIPVWPPPDSADGVFSVHCPAQSITTGNFSVNINLDLPEPGQTASNEEEIPPGYRKKSCECGVTVSVSKSGNSFKASAAPKCKGQYGIGINTFPGCFVKSVAYSWSIKSGAENVDLTGKKNDSLVNIRPKGRGAFTVCVTVTVTCIDGTICTASACADETGKTVTTPGGSETPPTTPETPVTTTRSRCKCSASCTIDRSPVAGGGIRYSGKVKAECTGTFGTGSTRSVCAVGPITYVWKVGDSAKDIVEIDGKNDGENVTLKRKKAGAYTLYLSGTVTCNDGTVCEYACNVEVPDIPPNEPECQPLITDLADPAMDGGLKSRQIGIANTSSMFRDEFIALEAEGADVDRVRLACDPRTPCEDTRSEKTISVHGRVRFEWQIEGAGKGSFVKLGCLPDDLVAEGERVIFKPPVIPLPKAADTVVVTTIKLSVIDDGSPVQDATKTKTITIRTKRTKGTPDKYSVEVVSADKYKLPSLPATTNINGTCSVNGPTWEQLDDLVQPSIQLPSVPDNDKMVLGQWILLAAADQRDNDLLKFRCVSASQCSTGPAQRSYPDLLQWNWTVTGGGKLILGAGGRFIIYEAPLEMAASKNVIEVKIRVTVKNPAGPRKDADKPPGEITLYIYRPGIKLANPDLTWLPEDNNSLELRSELMYKDGDWKPALAHMCRIHYFELVNVSNEKGVCLNNPVPKDADQCRDLALANGNGQEAWDDAKPSGAKCNTKELFQQARTTGPERQFTVTIQSKDFGAYGFLRAFANVNKKTSLDGKPVYVSIPVLRTDVTHPQGRLKKTEYADNRVTIPQDIDENRIADGGWTVAGGGMVPDPAVNNEDEDDRPNGDGFNGDGLSAYEEYRGFRVMDGNATAHIRTSYIRKDIFIRNESGLDLGTYSSVSGLQVHEISEQQYVDDRTRVVNPNFNTSTHIVNQMGLRLIDKGRHATLLGVAVMTTRQPAIPNQGIEVRIYGEKIAEVCRRKGIQGQLAAKIAAVTAHELLHANNVCHHGEQDPEVENSFNLKQGLRSGNVSCVMRYDNVGSVIRGFDPEAIGSDLCSSAAGTGYNANGNTFGDAGTGRGNCRGMIRVSGRGNPPRTCGNR